MFRRKKTLGLALGSGSARGLSHIGVIKALLEEGIEINYIAGTSIGSVVGAVYSAGFLDELEEFALQIDWKSVLSYFDLSFPKSGLLSGEKIYSMISDYFIDKTFDYLTIPFRCVATNLDTGKEVVFKEGNIVDAIRASIAVPGIFTPCIKDGATYVDGGLVNPVPVNVVKNMGADVVIAVDLNKNIIFGRRNRNKKKVKPKQIEQQNKETSKWVLTFKEKYNKVSTSIKDTVDKWKSDKEPSIFDIINSSFTIMQERITRINLDICKPDILIQPELETMRFFDFSEASSTINTGYEACKQVMPDIKKKLNIK